jgi:hypothetical protein
LFREVKTHDRQFAVASCISLAANLDFFASPQRIRIDAGVPAFVEQDLSRGATLAAMYSSFPFIESASDGIPIKFNKNG